MNVDEELDEETKILLNKEFYRDAFHLRISKKAQLMNFEKNGPFYLQYLDLASTISKLWLEILKYSKII